MRQNQNPVFIEFPSIDSYREAVLSTKFLAIETAKVAALAALASDCLSAEEDAIDPEDVVEPEPPVMPVVDYIGKVKIHGTNAAIVIAADGTYHCQSRTQVIVAGENDNAGFALWVSQRIAQINQILEAEQLLLLDGGGNHSYAIFGEWCGSKISPKVALSQLGRRVFVVFAVAYKIGETVYWSFDDDLSLFHNPEIDLYNVNLFGAYPITVDFNDPAAAQIQILETTAAVEAQCPAGKFFGLEGIGEGLVYTHPGLDPRCFFKSKGVLHKGTSKQRESISDEESDQLTALCDLLLRVGQIETRFEQAIKMLRLDGHLLDSMRDTKLVIDWVWADIFEENLLDIQASGLDQKQVTAVVTKRVREEYKELLKQF